MYVALDNQQTTVLREVLQSTLRQLRNESARADSHDFRAMLHQREDVIEQLLSKLDNAAHVVS